MTDPLDQPLDKSTHQPPYEPGGPTTPIEAEPYREPEPIPATTLSEPTRPAPGFNDKGKVKSTAVSGVWVGLIATAVFLILLVVFIAQNSRKVTLHFFGWHGQFSLALTILLSAVIGVLLVSVPGTVRILQLRRALRKNGPSKA